MKKIFLTLALVITMMTQLSANAFDWNSFFKWLFFGTQTEQTTVTTTEMSSTLSDIKTQSTKLNTSVKENFLAVVTLMQSKEDAKKVEDEIKAITAENITDAEKETKLLKIISNYTTSMKSSKVGTIAVMTTLSDSNKTLLVKSLKAISEDAQKYYELNSKGTKLASKVSKAADDEQAKILTELKEVNAKTKKRAEVLSSFSTQACLFAKLARLSI